MIPLLLTLVAAAAQPTAVSVKRVLDNIPALAGKTVVIRGWLEGCEIGNCALYSDQAGARAADAAMRGRKLPTPPYLLVGASFPLQSKIERLQRSYVVIIGRVNPATGWRCFDCVDVNVKQIAPLKKKRPR